MLPTVTVAKPGGWLLVSLLAASLCMNFLDIALAAASRSLPEAIVRVAELISAVSDPMLILPALGISAALSYSIPVLSQRYAWLESVKRGARPVTWLFASAALATILSLALKLGLGRLRPGYSDQLHHTVFRPFAMEEAFASMPSTHCAIAGAVTIGLSVLWPAIRTPMLLLGLAVCLSRALLGEHWASDTVMGWTLGAAVALLVLRTVRSEPPMATSHA